MKLKHILPAFMAFSLVSCGVFKSSGPDEFEGTITYGIDVSVPEGEDDSFLEQVKAMLPTEMTMGSDGTNFGMTVPGERGGTVVYITEENMLYQESGMGELTKTPLVQEEEDTTAPKPEIAELEETKEILGLTCKAYEITTGGQTVKVYMTEEFQITPPKGAGFIAIPEELLDRVKGTMMGTETKIEQGFMTIIMKLEATAINQSKEAGEAICTLKEGEYELVEE